MHERTQRAIARLMFVFCCAIPTSTTVLIVLVMATPWYANRVRRQIEAELARDTGLIVRIEDFHRTSPATLRLDRVRLIEPETMREVARVRQVEWVTRQDEVSILLQQPELQSASLPSTWRLIHDRFLCRPEQTSRPIRLAANDLTIHSASGGGMTLRDVDAWIEPQAKAVQASIQCVPAIASAATPIQITVRRDRSGEQPATNWMLDTQDTALPCSALSDYLPGLIGNLGNEAMFAGTMRWQLNHQDWWIDLSGSRIEQVSLDRIFEQQAHRLSGKATIQLERCRIEPGRRVDIAGSVRARDGLIGRSLLLSLHHHLDFEVRVPDGKEDLPYDRIAVRFNVDDTQLRLDGICRTEVGFESFPVGVVLCSGGYPLVRSSPQTLRSLALVSALAPAHSVMVPVADQNRGLMQVLIPPSRPILQDPQGAQRPKIQTARDWSGGPVTGQ